MLDTKTRRVLKKLIRAHIPDTRYKPFIFGSRVAGAHRPYSDIDLGIVGPAPLPAKQYIALKDAFEESDLPYKVDVVDFWDVSESFKNVALRHTIPL